MSPIAPAYDRYPVAVLQVAAGRPGPYTYSSRFSDGTRSRSWQQLEALPSSFRIDPFDDRSYRFRSVRDAQSAPALGSSETLGPLMPLRDSAEQTWSHDPLASSRSLIGPTSVAAQPPGCFYLVGAPTSDPAVT